MDRFFCPDLTVDSSIIELSPAEAHHAIRVLRKKQGDAVTLINGKGIFANGKITMIGKKSVSVIVEKLQNAPPPPLRSHIAIANIRPNRMDWVIEKLTELGITDIQPLNTAFTSVRTFKMEHLQKIAISALKQCQRLHLPKLHNPIAFSNWINGLPENTERYIAHMDDHRQNNAHHISLKTGSWVCLIGPEGGFDDSELASAKAAGFTPITLSAAVLRSETAAIAATTLLKNAELSGTSRANLS